MKSMLIIHIVRAIVLTSTDIFLMLNLFLFCLIEVYMLLWAFGKLPNPMDWLIRSIQKVYGQLKKT